MPHSGGGGSHGGGSHGGSHGGSSSRTSHHYFPGSRRYRRHYTNGRPDEYFYSNSTPQKVKKSAIAAMGVFSVFFMGLMGLGISSSIPKKLDEEYKRPDHRVYDTIGVINDEEELEEVLEDLNDTTGICPVVYTMFIEEYEDSYADLESFAYNKYVDDYRDEQHYLVVYAIPEDQIDYRGVPDFEFEVMQGDDTDNIMTESVDDFFVRNVQKNLDDGCDPGETFTVVFEALNERCDKNINSPSRYKILLPLVFVGAFLIIPFILMIRQYKKEKDMEYEEVPLTDDDMKQSGGTATASSALASAPEVAKAASVFIAIFLGFFALIGIGILISGIGNLISGSPMGVFMIIFGGIWTTVVAISARTSITGLKKKSKMYENETKTYDTPSRFDDDDDDLRRKGYE